MEKKIIKLTESDLHNIIKESVEQIIRENAEQELEEGWFGDKMNQIKSAGSTMLNKGNGSTFSQKMQNAKSNWKTQGQLNDLNNLAKTLNDFVEAGKLNPNMTIAQLIGGKINNNKFGRISSMAANRRSQIAKKGGSHY